MSLGLTSILEELRSTLIELSKVVGSHKNAKKLKSITTKLKEFMSAHKKKKKKARAGASVATVSYATGTATIDGSTLIANPGVGLQTTQQNIAQLSSNPRGYPCKNMTYRVHCSEVEATEGVYTYTTLDSVFAAARAYNCKVNLRFIWGEPATQVPSWVTAYGGYTATCSDNGDATTDRYPDWANSSVKAAFANQMNAFAARYKDHPAMGFLDASSIGLYGEGHWSGTTIVSKLGGAPGTIGQEIPMCSEADIDVHMDAIVSAWGSNIYFCPASMDHQDIWDAASDRARFGWRADGWGFRPNVGGPGYPSVQHGTLYPARLGNPTEDNTRYQVGPVALETYSSFPSWVSGNWDDETSFPWAVSNHASLLNIKNQFNHDASLDSGMDSMLLGVGARLSLVSVSHPVSVETGRSLALSTRWTNSGNAPMYTPYEIGVKLTNISTGLTYRVSTGQKPALLPGSSDYSLSVTPPTWLTAGIYSVSLGIIDPVRLTPEWQLAQSGADSVGWVSLTQVTLTSDSLTAQPTTDYAAQFSGSNYLSLTDNDSVSLNGTDFTISVRAYFDTLGATRIVYSKGDVGATGMEYCIYHDNTGGRISFRISNGSTLYTVAAATLGATATGTWYNILASFDNTSKQMSLRVNGGAADTATATGNIANGSNQFRIGADTIGRNLPGRVDKARYWKRLLTTDEQTEAMSNKTYVELSMGIKYGMFASWELDEASGTRYDSHGVLHLTDNGSVTQASAS